MLRSLWVMGTTLGGMYLRLCLKVVHCGELFEGQGEFD